MSREGMVPPHMEACKTGGITPQEAYLASQWLGLRRDVVSHDLDPDRRDASEFPEIGRRLDRGGGLAPQGTGTRPGETIRLD